MFLAQDFPSEFRGGFHGGFVVGDYKYSVCTIYTADSLDCVRKHRLRKAESLVRREHRRQALLGISQVFDGQQECAKPVLRIRALFGEPLRVFWSVCSFHE